MKSCNVLLVLLSRKCPVAGWRGRILDRSKNSTNWTVIDFFSLLMWRLVPSWWETLHRSGDMWSVGAVNWMCAKWPLTGCPVHNCNIKIYWLNWLLKMYCLKACSVRKGCHLVTPNRLLQTQLNCQWQILYMVDFKVQPVNSGFLLTDPTCQQWIPIDRSNVSTVDTYWQVQHVNSGYLLTGPLHVNSGYPLTGPTCQ